MFIKKDNMAVVEPLVLINEEYFKTYSPIPNNYNIKDIKPYFKVAEQIWVKPILGVALYEELLEEVALNQVSDVNSTLLLKIYPFLSLAICLEALPFIGFHFTEVGITKGKSDNSDSVSINDVNYVNNKLRTQVETLKNELVHFLKEFGDNYPLYRPEDTCECGHRSGHNPNVYKQCYSTRKKNVDIK